MTDNSSNFVGDIPTHYDQGLGPVLFKPYARDLASRVAEIAPRHLLELAAGTGIVTRHLAAAMGDGRIVATDLNAPMLEVARANLAGLGNIEFAVADAMQLPFDDAAFDCVACQFGVMFFPDKVAPYREARRVLRPGGHYVFNAWSSHEHNRFAAIAHDVATALFPDNPPGFYKVPFSYPDPALAIAEMKDAGFSEISVEDLPIESPVADWESFTRGIVYGNPLYDELIERGADPEDVRMQIRAQLRDAFGDSPTAMLIRAYVVTGTA